MNARYNYRRSRRKDTQGKAGRLYEHLIAHVLGCEITPRGKPELADLYSGTLGIRVESKSRGDSNSFELRTKQIKEYQRDIPFPLSDTLYALMPYKASNRLRKSDLRPRGMSPNTHGISLMRGLQTNKEYNDFWATHIQTSYLLDLRIIAAFGQHLGIRQCRMIGRMEEQAIWISRTTLNEFFGEDSLFSPNLRRLGLQPQGWAKGVYPIQMNFPIDDQVLSTQFTLVTILRKRLHASIAQTLANSTLALL
jgi:hypothetical protein